jgi:glycosyltransferase involved in cell wall biosynthesis
VKILHVEAGRHLYGGALQVLYLLRGLTARGLRNVLVCPVSSEIGAAVRDDGGSVCETPMHGDLDAAFVMRLWAITRREQPDLVHLHSRRGADVWGAVAARLAGVPVVLTRRVDNPEHRAVVALKYRLYDHVVTISDGIRQVLLSEGVSPARLTCVHSAVDTAAYDRDCDPGWFRSEFDLAPGERTLGVIAQLIPRKGHRHLFQALPGVLRRHRDCKILLFGRGPLESELRRLTDDPVLHDHVRWCGFRNDLARILPCLYAVIHPAEMEGLGVSLLQAAAAGVPVIASAAGGIPEIVRDRVNGLLIPPRDPSRLTAAIEQLLDDAEGARRMGEAGKRIAHETFSIDAMVEGNIRVYRQVLAGRAGGTPPIDSQHD